ncbi:hypothetical protein GGG16DRAFT_94884 [Schizophyllum commune]
MDAAHLRQSSSSGSSLTQRNGDTSYPPRSSKATLEQSSSAFEPALNSDAGRHPSSPPEGPPSRVQLYLEPRLNSIESSHPRAYARLRKALLYLRGPRPPTILPDPKPWLDIDITYRSRRLYVPIESTWLKLTRPLTSPFIFAILVAAYIIGFSFLTREQWYLTPEDSFVGCTSTFWLANSGCGLDGADCAPFDNQTFDFRCPASCAGTILQNPRTIGAEQMAYKPLIVGGGDDNQTYRGDSFICASAIQVGLIDDSKGGCASLSLIGNFTDFIGTTAHSLESIGFPTVFPLSFRFSSSTPLTHCTDIRWPVLAFDVVISFLVFTLFRPHPIARFWTLVCIGFWHVGLFSQPNKEPPELSDLFATFLPCLFMSYVLWRLAFRWVMPAFERAPLEGAVWYLGPFWVGILTGYTTDRLPLQRLYAPDLAKRSGAVATLVVIIIIVVLAALNQVRVIRKTGWLAHYVKWYVIGGLVVMVLALLPTLNLRIHHYFLALVLLPGTAWPTRPSAVYQGFLLGLFLNGAAAYGFDSILQTAAELRDDATIGSDLPTFLTNSSTYNASIPWDNQTIEWAPLPNSDWDGFVLLVDDVERYAGDALNYTLAALNQSLPHFFRLALSSSGTTGDFTNAATLYPNGTFVDPEPGASY